MLLGVTGALLTSCSNEDLVPEKTVDSGKQVHMVITALRESESDTESRTSLSQNDLGGLGCVWTKGDKILVTDATGEKLGTLTLKGDGGSNEGEFDGMIYVDNGKHQLNYIYLGTAISNLGYNKEVVPSGAPYVADFSKQAGTLESLSYYDILTIGKETVISEDYVYFGEIGFGRRVSFARFKMNLPEGAAYPVTVTLTGNELRNKANLNIGDRSASYDKGSVTIENVTGPEFYMTYLPTEAADVLNFTAVDAKGKSYIGTYSVNKAVPQNKYYRKALGNGEFEGLPINFTAVEYKYEVKYVTDGDQTVIEKYEPTSTGDIEWNVRNNGPTDIAGIEKLYALEDMEFDKWKDINTGNCPEIVTLSKGTPSYIFVPTWKNKATVNVTWEDGYTEDPLKTAGVKVGENEEKPIGDLFPNEPTREGYIFDGWEIDGKPVDPDDVTITKDDVENGVVITARWKPAIKTPGYGHGDFNN